MVDVPVSIWGELDLRWRGQVTLIVMPWCLYGVAQSQGRGN